MSTTKLSNKQTVIYPYKKHVLFIIGDWNAKVGSQETPGITGKFGLGIRNKARQRLIQRYTHFAKRTHWSQQTPSSNNTREGCVQGTALIWSQVICGEGDGTLLQYSCLVGRGCLPWPVYSLGKTLLGFALLHYLLQGTYSCYSRYFFTSYFCILVPYNEKDIFFGCLSNRSCRSS